MNKNQKFYKILYYFYACGFFGWVYETAAVLIETGKLTGRGLIFVGKTLGSHSYLLQNVPRFLDLKFTWGVPIIPIYGVGGVIVCLAFSKLKMHPIRIFFLGLFSMTAFEYISSVFCQYVLHKQFWNYDNRFLNINGRVCLESALAWGILTILCVYFLSPMIGEKFEKFEEKKHYKIIGIVLLIVVSVLMILHYIVFGNLPANPVIDKI